MPNRFGFKSSQPTVFHLQRHFLRLLFVLAGIFSFLPASAVNLDFPVTEESNYSQADILNLDCYSNLSSIPFKGALPVDLPLEEIRESEIPEKKDSGSEDENSGIGLDFRAFLCGKTEIRYYDSFTLNRTKVPFFILFHSWKSFLS